MPGKCQEGKMDREYVLGFLMRTAEAIAKMFGSGCETLVHDMARPNHPIVAIYNGHVSGRSVGSEEDVYGSISTPSEDISPEKLHAMNLLIGFKDHINKMAVTSPGRVVKSTTINFAGDGFHYALGINFDYTPYSVAAASLAELSNVSGNLQMSIAEEEETHLSDVYDSCFQAMGMPLEQMKKRHRLKLVELLYYKNAFNFQRAVTYIAERMDLSRHTIYKYLHEIEEKGNQQA